MPTIYYHTVDGEIQGETTAGVRTDYLTDALGSVVATVNSSAQVVNTYRYKPYGERLAKTGAGADPRFGWTGVSGSRRTERSFSDQYNQRRHYGATQAVWIAVDPVWPAESQYGYCIANPVLYVDPLGLQTLLYCIPPRKKCCCKPTGGLQKIVKFPPGKPPIPGATSAGAYFEFKYLLSPKMQSKHEGECTIKWEEKSNKSPYGRPGQYE